MIDLKRPKKTKKQLKNEAVENGIGYMDEKYPYGSRLRFNKPEIDKLDALKKANAGEKVTIKAIGKVIEVSTANSENGKDHHSVEVQIQKIEISGRNKDMPGDEKDAFNSKDED